MTVKREIWRISEQEKALNARVRQVRANVRRAAKRRLLAYREANKRFPLPISGEKEI